MEKLWFKRKLYGWGWYPCSWEGWLIVLFFIVSIYIIAKNTLVKGKVLEYFISLILLTLIIIYLGYKKGEKPKWSWGK